jgi:hypothetical protein
MRFVVVQIEDNDEADAFAEAVKHGAVYYAYDAGNGEVGFNQSWGWEVPQVYAVPTKFCECTDSGEVSAKSKSYGWWVHAKCGKPRPGAMQHPYNLVERAAGVHSAKGVYYIGFRADRRPWIIPKEQ